MASQLQTSVPTAVSKTVEVYIQPYRRDSVVTGRQNLAFGRLKLGSGSEVPEIDKTLPSFCYVFVAVMLSNVTMRIVCLEIRYTYVTSC